jgi:DNA (cytosine-5)-methyltransferase 1
MAPRPIHPDYPRCIYTREAARLHSFPDWFTFHETKWHGFMQIGNSVPPALAHAVAREVMKALANKG